MIMKIVLFITIFLLAHLQQFSQALDSTSKIEQVQKAISPFSANGNSVEIMLSDFTELKGAVTYLAEDSFGLKFKGVEGKPVVKIISYLDVISIKSKNLSTTFIPDASLRPFGLWDDVMKISPNHNLEVVLENGQSVTGRSAEITKDKLSLLTHADNNKISLLRAEIVYVYRVRIAPGKTKGVVAGGSNKGRKIGQEI